MPEAAKGVTPADLPIMRMKCRTCPFKRDHEDSVRQAVSRKLLSATQLCHHPRLHGKTETHICRGARDEQLTLMHRMGIIPKPTDAAWRSTWLEMQARSKGDPE